MTRLKCPSAELKVARWMDMNPLLQTPQRFTNNQREPSNMYSNVSCKYAEVKRERLLWNRGIERGTLEDKRRRWGISGILPQWVSHRGGIWAIDQTRSKDNAIIYWTTNTRWGNFRYGVDWSRKDAKQPSVSASVLQQHRPLGFNSVKTPQWFCVTREPELDISS